MKNRKPLLLSALLATLILLNGCGSRTDTKALQVARNGEDVAHTAESMTTEYQTTKEQFDINSVEITPIDHLPQTDGYEWSTQMETALEEHSETAKIQSVEEAEEYARRVQIKWLSNYAYVGSKESDRYHVASCRWTKEINEENLIYWDTVEQAKADGYVACKVCKPK